MYRVLLQPKTDTGHLIFYLSNIARLMRTDLSGGRIVVVLRLRQELPAAETTTCTRCLSSFVGDYLFLIQPASKTAHSFLFLLPPRLSLSAHDHCRHRSLKPPGPCIDFPFRFFFHLTFIPFIADTIMRLSSFTIKSIKISLFAGFLFVTYLLFIRLNK